MCIVIDTNTLSHVFNKKDEFHKNYKIVFDWIDNGNGRLVYGGDYYINELARASRYFELIVQYKKANKAVNIDEEKPDFANRERARIISITRSKEYKTFNDSHIIAVVIVARCRIVCTTDGPLSRFVKDRSLYPNKFKIPEVFNNKSKNKKALLNQFCNKDKKCTACIRNRSK